MTAKTAMLWGVHPVTEALRAGKRRIDAIYLAREAGDARVAELIRLAEAARVGIRTMSTAKLTERVGHGRHQGVGAAASFYPFCTVDTILEAAENDAAPPFIVVLDQIVDPQNLGAIARTAYCAGVHGLVMPAKRSAPPSAAASKASAGALEHLALAQVTNVANTLKHFKTRGFWIAGADHTARRSVFGADLSGPLAIVIGGEEKGIRPLVKKQCDFTVSIPQTGPIGSLNASAASAIMIYEAFRQRMLR